MVREAGNEPENVDYPVTASVLSVRSFNFLRTQKYFANSLQFLGQMYFIVLNINNCKLFSDYLLKKACL